MENSASPPTLNTIEWGEILIGPSQTYQVEEFMGQGTYGEVVKCRVLETGEFVAVKVIRMDRFFNGVEEAKTMRKIKKLNPDRNNLLNLKEHFIYKDHFCLVYDLLDMDLDDYLDRKRLQLSEIRVITYQILVALEALKSVDMVHGDIKPNNIMLVNHQLEPFKVKLIDFGIATEAPNLLRNKVVQNLAYRPPEVLLRHLNMDQAIDMWSLGCALANLYLSDNLFPYKCEYEAMRMIIQLLGMPDNEVLDEGFESDRFFDLVEEAPKRMWLLKSPENYTEETGEQIVEHKGNSSRLGSLDDLLLKQPDINNPVIRQDMMAFISLLKRMLEVNPRKRITPSEALRHNFLTMKHFSVVSKSPYVAKAKKLMSGFHLEEENSISHGDEEDNSICDLQENRNISGSHDSKDLKQVNAASLMSKINSDMADNAAAHGIFPAPGSSEKLDIRKQSPNSSPNKEDMSSVPRTGEKEQKDASKNLDEVVSCVEDVTSAPGIVTEDQESTSKGQASRNRTNEGRSRKTEVTSVPITGTKITDVTSENLVVRNRTPGVTSGSDKVTSEPRTAAEDPKEPPTPLVLKNRTNEMSSNEEEITSVPRTATEDPEEASRQLSVDNEIFEATSSKEEATSEVKPAKKPFRRIRKFFSRLFKCFCICKKDNEVP